MYEFAYQPQFFFFLITKTNSKNNIGVGILF
jgi:hypothetical protein